MGKQIGFYMVDEDEFIDFIRTTGDIFILPSASKKRLEEQLETHWTLDDTRLSYGFHLWNRSVSPCPVIKYIPEQECYWLDAMKSEVVEVDRCRFVGNRLCAGRLYVNNKIFAPDGTIVEKGAEFLNWFERLRRWVRKTHKDRFQHACLSARAEVLAKSGVEL